MGNSRLREVKKIVFRDKWPFLSLCKRATVLLYQSIMNWCCSDVAPPHRVINKIYLSPTHAAMLKYYTTVNLLTHEECIDGGGLNLMSTVHSSLISMSKVVIYGLCRLWNFAGSTNHSTRHECFTHIWHFFCN